MLMHHTHSGGATSKSITQPNSPRITIAKQAIRGNSDKSKSNGSSFANGGSGSQGATQINGGGLNIGQTIVMPSSNDYQMMLNEAT
jgi:hypothetical protein